MKIAMIGHKRIPSREGGVEIVVEELSSRMVKLGHNVDVYNRSCRGFSKSKSYKGIRIITIPTIHKKSLDACIYSFFSSIRVLFGKYNVIHYHAEGPCTFLWIPHLFHKRTVVTIHGLDWQRKKWGAFASGYIKLGEKIAAKYANEIIVLSRKMQKYFLDTYGRDTTLVPNGVTQMHVREPDIIKAKYGLDKDSYLLFLARIVPEKGLHYLLEAYKYIQTDKRLVIAGEGSYTNDYCKKIIEMAKQDKRVIMTGFVQGEELEELFSNCYLYVLPSDVEGMPISLLEAMSFGCACLVSDIEEHMELVKDTATHFKKGNVNELIHALNKCLLQKPSINIAHMKDNLSRNHSWEYVVNKILELY